MDWYSLRVISGKEKSTEENILREAGDNDITSEIEEVFVPFEKVVEMRNNKKRIREKMFFPGYILIKMNLNANTKYIVENAPGVLSFVGPKGSNPVPLREDEIKRIFGEVERKEGMEVIDIPFKKGDAIKVIAGPFIDFTGFVEIVNEDKQKVKVMVSIFGRPTPIELDFFQVELEK
jgi:transcriptional antiterminator NusG